jgi:DEAD/DEAH box helicase domain-containing protein
VAQATLQCSKSGSGWDAIKLFREGRMDELKKYCIDDVRLTKDIYEYGLKNGKILFTSNRDYQMHEVPVQWGGTVRELLEKRENRNAFPTSLF